jgi:hypothetical protein
MSLTNCPECKKEVSDRAESCPNCGYPTGRITMDTNSRGTSINRKSNKRSYTTPILLIIVSGLIFYFWSNNSFKPIAPSIPANNSVNISVKNVRISKDYPNAWAVKGSIKNNTDKPLKGAVKIKFKDSNGDIVHSAQAYVNDGDYFNPGQSASFEYFESPERFKDVVDFDVEFYEI